MISKQDRCYYHNILLNIKTNMSKRIILLFVGVFFFLSGKVVLANVSINEIMYNAEGADVDWVEIYNNENSDFDVSTLNLLVSNSTSNHGITKYFGSEILHKGDFGIIVASSQIESFVSKFGNSFNLFTSSFSLPNISGDETAKIEINIGDKNSPIDSVSYKTSQGADGDGNSLQLINGTWKSSTPTPGIKNNTTAVTSVVTGSVATSGISSLGQLTEQSATETKTKVIEVPTIKAKIVTKSLAFVGIPFEIKPSLIGYSGETLRYGKCFWNFGDGDSKEQINSFDKFLHTYSYPGEYTISLEYNTNYYSDDIPSATNEMVINVVPLSVSISKTGDEKDFFIELSNNSDYKIDISRWIILSLDKKFILPKNTILPDKGKIILSPQITNFTINDKKNLKLEKPTGEVVFTYGVSLDKQIKQSDKIVSSFSNATVYNKINLDKNNSIEKDDMQIGDSDLLAGVSKSETGDGNNSSWFFAGFIILLSVSSIVLYFIRRRKVASTLGNDFEILDE